MKIIKILLLVTITNITLFAKFTTERVNNESFIIDLSKIKECKKTKDYETNSLSFTTIIFENKRINIETRGKISTCLNGKDILITKSEIIKYTKEN